MNVKVGHSHLPRKVASCNIRIYVPQLPKEVVPYTEIFEDGSFELGSALESQPHLLEHVFKFLNISDLHSAKFVNLTWEEYAERELQKRITPAWITCSYTWICCSYTQAKRNVLSTSGLESNNAALCLITYYPKTIRPNSTVHVDGYDSGHNLCHQLFGEYIHNSIIPPGVDYCTIGCTGLPEDQNETVLFQGVFMPYIPNVRTAIFYCNPRRAYTLSNYINENEQVKCVLLFTRKYIPNKQANIFLTTLLKGQHPESVAMGGGLIRQTQFFPRECVQQSLPNQTKTSLLCVTFLQEEEGEANFNAYSVVIHSDEDETIDGYEYQPFETELLKLKETSILRKFGVIFRFCCCAKSCKQDETALIRKHFPKYPVMGMDVEGEIGWNTSSSHQKFNNEPKGPSKAKKFKASLPETLHGWSTVLVLITWGKKL